MDFQGDRHMKKSILTFISIVAILAFSHTGFAATKASQLSKNKAAISQAELAIRTSEKVNLNTATAEEIASILTGIGLKKATAIVNYRKQHGQFKTVAELEAVKGIGPMTITKNEGRIVL